MCTALSLTTREHYFGRNLDLDCSYNEEICIAPRRFPFDFRKKGRVDEHYAIIGMATFVEAIPLFYDAANEAGLAMAGLNFPNNACYYEHCDNKDNITPFEFIPWILSLCKNVAEARERLDKINLVNIPFSNDLPLSPLHWIISDSGQSIVVEAMRQGMKVYENPVGVLTNNPPFDRHLLNLEKYSQLSASNDMSGNILPESYCSGLGAVGLPGDVSSMSRFVRMAFGRENSVCAEDEPSSVNQFFHLLSSVEMCRGACKTDSGGLDITVYSSCINTARGLYYYTTYDNRQINCVDMHKTDLSGNTVSRFPLIKDNSINHQN